MHYAAGKQSSNFGFSAGRRLPIQLLRCSLRIRLIPWIGHRFE
jgi:hypothetical protein